MSTSLGSRVAQFEQDVDLAHQIVQGGPTTEVQTEGGPVRSFAKLQADLEAELNAAAAVTQAGQLAAQAEASAGSAAGSAASAGTDRVLAEAARDAAQLSAGVYPDTAAGLTATASGQYFSVPSANSAEYLVLYRNNSGVAQEERRYPSATAVNAARALWLANDATPSASYQQLLDAIDSIRVIGGDKAKTYRLATVCNDDPTYTDNMIIMDGEGGQWSAMGAVAGKDSGPIERTLTAANAQSIGSSFRVLIDYRKITTTGIILNTIGDMFRLSRRIYDTDDVALAAEVAAATTPINQSVATHSSEITALTEQRQKWWRDTAATTLTSTAQKEAQSAILAVRVKNGDRAKAYRMAILCKDDAALKDRLWIQDSPTTRTWAFEGTVAGKADGPVWVTLASAGSTTSFDVLVDYRKITTPGIILNTTSDFFRLSPQILEWDRLRAEFPAVPDPTPLTALARAIRVSVAGSSIIWGEGWLGENSYVGEVERHLRTVLATTLHGADFTVTGTSATVSNKLFYKGSAVRLQGANSEASFSLYGDELSLCIARERGNAGASLVEVYADGSLLDTFSTWNDEPYATGLTDNFTGDGATRQFDLGHAFTFGHVVTVGSVAKTVQMNTGGYGASFPAGVDALVIRKLVTVAGVPQVRHFLWFAAAPANGAAIAASFSAGESVTYVRGTVGQTTQPLTGSNESAYGDGNVAYDPANPANLSSGLGFRETDPRAIKTWHFSTAAKRAFRVKIVGLDPRATGTPQLYLNAATNRMHHIQNAGIGGWTAALLLNDTGLNNLSAVTRFQPDVLLLESCTNDDWDTHIDRAWRTRTGLIDASVRGSETAAWFRSVTYVSADNYTVEDVRIPITAISEYYVELAGADATFEVTVGDVVILGDFKGDNRRLACRVVKAWDAATRRITWARPLEARELAHINSLSDLIGSSAMVKGAPSWVSNVESIIDQMQATLPECQLVLGTSGIPNLYYRRLEGYRELAADVARRKGTVFSDFYRRTLAWQYSQPATVQAYLDASQSTTSTGASEYILYDASGAKPTGLLDRGWSVTVNGVERINDGCYVMGGQTTGWGSGVSPMTKGNTSLLVADYRLVFDTDVAAAGATIVVKRAASKWSSDDCHPAGPGLAVFGQAAIAALASSAPLAAAKAGAKA